MNGTNENVAVEKRKSSFSKVFEQMKKDWILYVMLIPFVLWYILFVYRPIGGLQVAFKDYQLFLGVKDSPWVGFENFKVFLTGPYFLRLLKNTATIGFYNLIFGFPAPILLALLLNEVKNKLYKKSIQTAVFMPYFISTVVVASIVVNLLSPSGLFNAILGRLGVEPIFFLSEPKYFRSIYTTMHIWQTCGYNSIIYLAAFSGIDSQLYEACVVDGGNKLTQLRHVTLPGVLPTVAIMLIMACGGILSVGYESIILLYQPSTYQTADVISTYTYRIGLSEGNYGLATAVGLFNSIVSIIFVSTANFISKKLTENSLW